jgi:hypothetical protein
MVGLAVIGGIMVDQATGGAWNRSVVLAAPCVLGLRRLPWPVLAGAVVVAGTLAALIAYTYFNGSLI